MARRDGLTREAFLAANPRIASALTDPDTLDPATYRQVAAEAIDLTAGDFAKGAGITKFEAYERLLPEPEFQELIREAD